MVDGLILQEVPHQSENRGVQHGEAESDSGLSDGLSQVGLADARWAQKEDVGVKPPAANSKIILRGTPGLELQSKPPDFSDDGRQPLGSVVRVVAGDGY